MPQDPPPAKDVKKDDGVVSKFFSLFKSEPKKAPTLEEAQAKADRAANHMGTGMLDDAQKKLKENRNRTNKQMKDLGM